MCQDKKLKRYSCEKALCVFKQTLEYFITQEIEFRIKGFIRASRKKVSAHKKYAYLSGVTYDVPEHNNIYLKIDRIFKDLLNRRRTSEKFGIPLELPKD